MNPKLIISNFFDSLVNLIDIYTEEQLDKLNKKTAQMIFPIEEYSKKKPIIKPWEEEFIKNYEINYFQDPYSTEYDFSQKPSRKIPHGSVKVNDFLNQTRDELLAEVNSAQVEAFKRCDELRDQLRLISKDETKTQEEREEDIKRKVFANEFIGLVHIDQIFGISSEKNFLAFKLNLVKLDYYMSQDEQLLFRL